MTKQDTQATISELPSDVIDKSDNGRHLTQQDAAIEMAADADAAKLKLPRPKADPSVLELLLPAFPKVIHVPFTEAEFADRAKKMNAFDNQIAVKELDKKDFDAKINGEIKDLEAQRRAVSEAVGRGGEDKEVTCRKLVDFDKSISQLIVDDHKSPHHLEILEERKLNLTELQTEMKLASKGKDGKLQGKWPEAEKVGGAEKDTTPEPNWDAGKDDKPAAGGKKAGRGKGKKK